jgi:hypothetical protein
MNQNLENKQHAINDQDLEMVSGGGPDFYEEYPVYSVGQRVRFQYFTDYNFTPHGGEECYFVESVGTVFRVECDNFSYMIKLDTPAPSGELWVPTRGDWIFGLA